MDEILSKIDTDSFNDENIKIIFQDRDPFQFDKNKLTIGNPDYRNLSMPEKMLLYMFVGF